MPEQLARQFGSKGDLARLGVPALYAAVREVQPPALERWKDLFGKASGRDLGRPSVAVEKLAKGYGIAVPGLRSDALLFALHTYYAMVVALLVRRLTACGDTDILDADGSAPLAWHAAAGSRPIERLVDRLNARLAEFVGQTAGDSEIGDGDLFEQLYQGLFPARLRHELGEYYTPQWLAEHVLDQVGYNGRPGQRLLDPACGSGTFLVSAIRRARAAQRPDCDAAELRQMILADVAGCDLNPLAALTAKANYLIAIRDLIGAVGRVEVPVYCCDSILAGPPPQSQFDYVVGNPPWIAWDNLPADYRQATKPLWERYGLFSLSANEARHGGAKKDLSMLMLYATADRDLRHGGRLGMVITQTLFQTKGAGDGFRRFRLGPAGAWLRVRRVDDMVALRPFKDAANWTSAIFLEKGAPTEYPVPYFQWSPGGDGDPIQRSYLAEPIEASRPASPWFLRPAGLLFELSRLTGPSDYVAHLGANSGGANGVYWVTVLGAAAGGVLIRNAADSGRRGVEAVEQIVEPGLLYPLIRWGDVKPYCARPSAHIILSQDVDARVGIDEAAMRSAYPRTHQYLKRFEGLLTRRAAYRRYQQERPFYSMYNVGPYTLAPIKVVWRRMDRRLSAAVVETVDNRWLGPRPVVPQETCVLVACQSTAEAHYICAVLNSAIVNFLVGAHSVRGGKGFGTPSILDFVRLRRFEPGDARHAQLTAWSREAHSLHLIGDAAAREYPLLAAADLRELQCNIDALTADIWGLDRGELRSPTLFPANDNRCWPGSRGPCGRLSRRGT